MDKVLKIYQGFLKYVSPVVIAFFSYFLSNYFLLNLYGFPEEQQFNLNIVIYSTAILGFLTLIEKILLLLQDKESEIIVSFSDNKYRYPHNDLDLNFQSDVREIFMEIKLNGNPEKLKMQTINIVFPTQVQVQLLKDSEHFCMLDDNNNQVVKIKLDNIINKNKKETIADKAYISLIVSKIYEQVGGYVEVSFDNKPKFIKLRKNKLYLDK